MSLEPSPAARGHGPHRAVLAGVGLLTMCVVLFISFVAFLSMGLGVCGGDAGETYASAGSAASRFCTSAVGDVVIWATLLLPPLLGLALAIGGVVRRSWGWAAASGWLPLAVVVLTSIVVWGLPE